MYQPVHFRQNDPAQSARLIAENPLGLLVTNGAGGLMANSLPFLLDVTRGPHGVLRAHCARANPQWREADGVCEALVTFQDADAYVSPGWYPSKAETGKVVPTWNYAMAHIYGVFRAIEDPVWLRAFLDDLTAAHEADKLAPWQVGDAPPDFIAGQLRQIVGLEIEITRIEAKNKLSQNRVATDRAGVVAGLRQQGALNDDARAIRIAGLMEETQK